jgi:hypothetical protein
MEHNRAIKQKAATGWVDVQSIGNCGKPLLTHITEMDGMGQHLNQCKKLWSVIKGVLKIGYFMKRIIESALYIVQIREV